MKQITFYDFHLKRNIVDYQQFAGIFISLTVSIMILILITFSYENRKRFISL
jgi:hypothetical protein